ncbi:hypothetical protein DICVIV_12220 [Dictyocaulus viviparus]|uniref:UBZ4-type domain-containing protein n=1 Tax=Dictyocaulus viviparus TaxID=29172 RepID=A0A0D8XDS7_DICVI|nr:hypothetical protein DICVIV_12220 [Dictyocaulus viviparus]
MAKESDDDFCSPQPTVSLLAAPRRPEKKGEIQSVPVISVSSKPAFSESCELNVDTSLLNEKSDLGDQCAICSKSISHLNNIRKTAHVNKCLDAQESSDMHIKAKEKWNSMIDCPMCGQPLPLGPHRSAHAKRCGKIHNVAPKELLKLMETQRRVCDAKKLRNIPHTKAPVPIKKKVVPVELKDAPNSLFAENLQYAKALSASEFPEPTVEVCENSPQFKRYIFLPNFRAIYFASLFKSL